LIVLGIESSCDETSASIVKDGKLLSNVVHSQTIHNKYGGVVPEIASREHLVNIVDVVEASIDKSNINITDIDGIAVTYGAGLLGALLVGLNFAKGLSVGLGIPFIGINHLEGHLFSNLIESEKVTYPFLCLLVSGGHTQIWEVNTFGKYNLISNTIDDAAGEAFDKGARILGLGYPGGPEIEKSSIGGNEKFHAFPRPMVKNKKEAFSFSGLKTSLKYYIQNMESDKIKFNLSDVAASYQEAIVDTLIDKLKYQIEKTSVKNITIAGGVAANKRFRFKLDDMKKDLDLIIKFPDIKYCTDNAAMIAMAGYYRLINKEYSDYGLHAVPNLSL